MPVIKVNRLSKILSKIIAFISWRSRQMELEIFALNIISLMSNESNVLSINDTSFTYLYNCTAPFNVTEGPFQMQLHKQFHRKAGRIRRISKAARRDPDVLQLIVILSFVLEIEEPCFK